MTHTTHIKNSTTEDTSWCGELINNTHFNFKNAEDAALNGKFGNLLTCSFCTQEIINCLENGRNANEKGSTNAA